MQLRSKSELQIRYFNAKGKSYEVPKRPCPLCEDDPESRELIVLVLKASGYEVVCTATGTEALDLAKNERFDLFVSDLPTAFKSK